MQRHPSLVTEVLSSKSQSLMHSGHSLIAELESAVAKGSPEQRVSTLRRVTDLFLNGADRFDEQQVGLFDDVLLHLVQGIEVRALAELSTTLATVDGAPSGVVRRLAYDDDITVAGPVLTHSKQISGDDRPDQGAVPPSRPVRPQHAG